MSNAAAGKRFESKIKEYLESLGFKVDKARAALHFIGPGKFFSSPCDFFGAADLIAVHKEKPYTLFIQAHRGTSLKPRREKLEAVPWNLQVQKVQLWTAQEGVRGGVRVLELDRSDVSEWRETIFRLKEGENPPAGVL